MVESPMTRYPRMFVVFMAALVVISWGTLKLGYWFAENATEPEPKTLIVVGWALGAGAVLVMNRLARSLDTREQVVADIERRLGGNA